MEQKLSTAHERTAIDANLDIPDSSGGTQADLAASAVFHLITSVVQQKTNGGAFNKLHPPPFAALGEHCLV